MKKEVKFLCKLLLIIPLAFLFTACDEDENEMEAWEVEINQLKAATAKYTDVSVAEAEGFIDVSGFVPNMGHHFLLPPRVDNAFELEKPEIILYAPNANGEMEFVGVEYITPIADLDNPGTPPEGFSGGLDEWEINPNLSQWQLHVWIVKENPDGIFKTHNMAIGDGK